MIMNRFLASLALVAVPFFVRSQELPMPSPLCKLEQRVGLTDLRIEYSRPSMKGRVIFGELVPFDQVWRTGANKCTLFECSGPVMIEGKELAAGKYALFTIPAKSAWKVIFNSDPEQWGAFDRKPEKDVLTVEIPCKQLDYARETLTMGFDDLHGDSAMFYVEWDKSRISLHVFANATDQGQMNIKEAMAKGDMDASASNRSARFYLDRGLMPDVALKLALTSVMKEKKYWNAYTLALAQAANGQYNEAIVTAGTSKQMAMEAKENGVVKDCEARIAEWTPKVGR